MSGPPAGASAGKPRFFAGAAELRSWLAEHHASATELWVGFRKKGSRQPSVTYQEALDEALCFGWIDGVRKSVDASSYTNRFSPRKARSHWSAVNLRRVEELRRAGRVTPAGLAALAARRPERTQGYSYEQRGEARLDAALEARLRAAAAAWDHFQAQPPGYRKLVTWWVVSAKREETRLRRLDQLIACSAAGERLPGL
jgi:uncharacterized protein YdeI (YjbR/CyaY-like superfamily)